MPSSSLSSVWKWVTGVKEARMLMMGLDAAGKTTVLYMLKLGEVVTTIPTIGFNVETVKYNGIEFTTWDVGGGCGGRVRALWRHYFLNTQVLLFVVDSNDRERVGDAAEELHYALRDADLAGVPVLVLANKRDLANAMSIEEVTMAMRMQGVKDRLWFVQPAVATTGEGLYEALNWAGAAHKRTQASSMSQTPGGELCGGYCPDPAKSGPIDLEAASRQAEMRYYEAVLQQYGRPGGPTAVQLKEKVDGWLVQPDEDTDDEFLQALEACTLERWDHYAHLRLAWAYLVRHDGGGLNGGRREAMRRIFQSIKDYTDKGPAARKGAGGTKYHETMTYFWSHMVHYALATVPEQHHDACRRDFKSFLRYSPQLADGGLFLKYYTKDKLLMAPEPRTQARPCVWITTCQQ